MPPTPEIYWPIIPFLQGFQFSSIHGRITIIKSGKIEAFFFLLCNSFVADMFLASFISFHDNSQGNKALFPQPHPTCTGSI